MNILVKAIQDAMQIIPDEITTIVFRPAANGWRQSPITIEESIMAKVIRKRVIPDANIATGEHMMIRLAGITPVMVEDYRSVFEIPARLLHNRTILSVLGVSYSPYSAGMGAAYSSIVGGAGAMFSQDTAVALQQMVESTSAVPNVSTCRADLVGVNTVMIEDSQRAGASYDLSCYVTDENFLNQLDPRAYHLFSELAEHAIKAYIFKNFFIAMGRSRNELGADLPEFKEIVDSYRDSEVNYRTFLREKWKKTGFISNSDRMLRFLKAQVMVGL